MSVHEAMIGHEVVVAGALAGDPPAGAARSFSEEEFERFYAQHSRPLWNFIARTCGDRTVADDLLQKTFVRFLQAPLRVADDRQLRSYLYRIATNLTLDHWRSGRREIEFTLPASLPLESSAILRTDMEKVFARLKPKERAMLWLAHVEGYDHQEIAAVTGVKPASLKVLLFRARRNLAALLRKEGITGGLR